MKKRKLSNLWRIVLIKIQKVKKSIKEEENERNFNSKYIDTSNANLSEIKEDSISEIEKKIIENVDISKNNNIMEIDEFEQYKNEKNKEELNYRTYKSEKNPKI